MHAYFIDEEEVTAEEYLAHVLTAVHIWGNSFFSYQRDECGRVSAHAWSGDRVTVHSKESYELKPSSPRAPGR